MKSLFINIAQAGVISDAPTFQNIGVNTLSFLLSAVGIIAIIMLAISAARYFFSAGNEKMAEDAKKSAKYAIVGIVLALSGMIIIKTIGGFFN